MTYSPTVPGGGAASYKPWPVFMYSNGYFEVYRRFQVFCWGEGLGDVATWEDLCLEEFVMGEEKFNEGGAGFSSIIIKKQWKNKYEKVFSTESKERH